jgi:hypothetical protein
MARSRPSKLSASLKSKAMIDVRVYLKQKVAQRCNCNLVSYPRAAR